MIKQLRVIGDGGAFDTHLVNSSFLIETDKTQILIDCGYNVFPELMRLQETGSINIENISTIFITHMDDDHMGSLKSFLYYRYFVLGLTTTVYGNADLKTYISDNFNYELKSSKETKAPILYFGEDGYIDRIFKLGLKEVVSVNQTHHVPTKGFIFTDDNDTVIAISGDTKANYFFETILNRYMKLWNKTLLFHDYSYWNVPARQRHTCKSDFESEYSETFRNNVIKYHNDKANIAGNVYFTTNKGWKLEDEEE